MAYRNFEPRAGRSGLRRRKTARLTGHPCMRFPTPLLAAMLFALPAQAQQQRIYGPEGRSLGTVSTDSAGTQQFRDARGNSTGTATTDSQGNTTVYDPRGNVVGRTTNRRN